MIELDGATRRELFQQVTDAVEAFHDELSSLPVAPTSNPQDVRRSLAEVDFSRPMAPSGAVELVVRGLRDHQVHTGHPAYFGLFNPAVAPMAMAADTLVAAFNPQLAAWTHAPFACEVEQLLLREFGGRFGYAEGSQGGSFTSGGAEANHSALSMALCSKFPDVGRTGLRGLAGAPTLYVSSESHHSFVKAASLCGLGHDAVREVPTDAALRLSPEAVAERIVRDRAAGDVPFLVVATLGTTGAGILDPVNELADVAEREGVWLHADAAWGGAAALLPELASHFDGLGRADSITFDAHKWMSVSMAAGLFLTRHPDLQERTFAVDTGYMPVASGESAVVEPHRTSMQWTRRFIGLKLFLTLLVAGFEGYERMVREMVRLGDVLSGELEAEGFTVLNETPLPVACVQDSRHPRGDTQEYLEALAGRVVSGGRAWVSTTRLGESRHALRACISNFRNTEATVAELVQALAQARDTVPPR